MRRLATDYLVIGAGAMGMAFVDALIDHADVHVTVVDRRHQPGGHWQDAYPFVRLHQASLFYGVASTELGDGAVQPEGPEEGLQERATADEIRTYYAEIMQQRLLASGNVTFLGGHEHRQEGTEHVVTSRLSGERILVDVRRRVVDAAYLSPRIPATSPPPFTVADGARVITVNQLVSVADAPSQYVIAGSGKTATDAVVWLLSAGVDPDRIVWVRPRDPWMLNRAVVQPDPVVATDMAADVMTAGAAADSPDDLFLRLEAAGVMLRIDPAVTPTMAKTPTLAEWELRLLRTVDDVVRRGHVTAVSSSEMTLRTGVVPLAPDALVVHCASSGLAYPPMVPIWGRDRIRLQTVRVGFPCFCAALAGYVEATRDDDRERNRLCPPNTYADTPTDWAAMFTRGTVAAATYGAEPDILAWADQTALNPSRVTPAMRTDPSLLAAQRRLADASRSGLPRMAQLAGDAPGGRDVSPRSGP